MKISSLLSTVILTLISGSTLAQSWHQQGFDDGAQGKPVPFISDEALDLYKQGYLQGLQDYCSIDNAQTLAQHDKTYLGLCDNNDGKSAFRSMYEEERDEFQKEKWLKLSKRSWY